MRRRNWRRWRRWRSLSLWLMLFALPALGDSDDYNPFRIPKAEFFGSVRTVGLMPMIMPSDLADSEQVRREIETRLTDRLEAHGLIVIPSVRIERRWNELSTLVGGTYDALTGKAETEKILRVKDILNLEFALGDGVDAFLQPRISMGPVGSWAKNVSQTSPEGGRAKSYTAWMAAHEPIFWRGEPVDSRWEYRPTRAIGPRLGLSMRDPAEIELYNIMIPIRYERIYMNGGYDDRAESSLLDHLDRIEDVIEALTEDLVKSEDSTSP